MNNRVILYAILSALLILDICACAFSSHEPTIIENSTVEYSIIETDIYPMEVMHVEEPNIEEEIFYDSLEYLAMCVEAEAGNQSELGKRLVCDVVLNRFYSGDYETLYDVINEKHQFSVVSDNRINEVIPTEETYRIVREEVESMTNTDVMFFRTDHYHEFGTPLFKEGDHYFSK